MFHIDFGVSCFWGDYFWAELNTTFQPGAVALWWSVAEDPGLATQRSAPALKVRHQREAWINHDDGLRQLFQFAKKAYPPGPSL
jgi:hypothetical protein